MPSTLKGWSFSNACLTHDWKYWRESSVVRREIYWVLSRKRCKKNQSNQQLLIFREDILTQPSSNLNTNRHATFSAISKLLRV